MNADEHIPTQIPRVLNHLDTCLTNDACPCPNTQSKVVLYNHRVRLVDSVPSSQLEAKRQLQARIHLCPASILNPEI
jgi:hypothetical protein